MKSHQSSQIVEPISENVNIIQKGNNNQAFRVDKYMLFCYIVGHQMAKIHAETKGASSLYLLSGKFGLTSFIQYDNGLRQVLQICPSDAVNEMSLELS